MTEDTKDTGGEKAADTKKEHQPPAGARTVARWEAGEDSVDYIVNAGWLVLRKEDKPVAEMFSVSYVAAGRYGVDLERPVTFVFNGGPGASSAFLQMGAVGPTRVAFPADGTLPRLPPKLVTNEASWIPFTDLVFVDPIGTGFSRVIPAEGEDKPKDGEDPTEYFGYKRDLETLCEFMSRWLSNNGRWGSPVLIAGESYGGYRVGRLVKMAQENAGIGLNGAILISPAMEIWGLDPNDYDVTAWLDLVPTMALAAAHHGRSRAFGSDASLEEIVAAAEEFATGDHVRLLTRGASLSDAERARILGRLADLIGLDVGFVTRAEGRIGLEVFSRELLRDERKVLGFYDATVTATDPFPDRASFAGPDPTLAGQASVFTAAINRQLRGEIGIQTDREYVLLNYDAFSKWKNDAPEHFFSPPVGATDDFRYGMALNPHMRAFITHGRYDLVTPFYASDRLVNLMRLDEDTASRLTVQHFGGGHMFYAWEQSRRDFTAAIKRFYVDAVPPTE